MAHDPIPYIALYRDAAEARPYGARWKALFVSTPGSLTGSTVRCPRTDTEMEFRSAREAVAFLVKHHGAVKGDIVRTFLPRYEGKEGFYAVSDRLYPV